MKKLILCPSSTQKEVISFYLNKHNDSLFGIDILSISQFLSRFLTPKVSLYQQQKHLQSLSLPLFHKAIEDYAFVEELLHYQKEFEQYHVNIDDLPIDEELKTIFKEISPRGYHTIFESLKSFDASHIEIQEESYPIYSLYEEKIIASLKEKGAHSFSLYSPNRQHQNYRITVQTEKEQFEAAIQYIIRQQLPLENCAFILADQKEMSLLISILDRYHIPFNKFSRANKAAKKLQALLKYRQQPNIHSILSIANLEIFGKNHPSFSYYLSHYAEKTGISFPFSRFQTTCPSFLSEKEIIHLRRIEEKAEEVRKPIQEGLFCLDKCKDLRSFLVESYRYLADDSIDSKALKSFLQERGKEIEDAYENYLYRELSLLMINESNVNGLSISTVNQAIHKDYLFVFDANEGIFPSFQPVKGLLREEFLQESSYPNIKEREDHYFRSLAYLDESDATYYFVPQIAYNGNMKTISLLIEEKECQELVIPIYREPVQKFSEKHFLSPSLANEAFFDEKGVLSGSVSAFETYLRNPYDYFLKYALRLPEKERDDLNPMVFGNITHSFLEHLVKTYGRYYWQHFQEELSVFLDKEKEKLLFLHPHKEKEILETLERYHHSLSQSLDYLAQSEANSPFIAEHCEFEFEQEWPMAGEEKIHLRGKIDRIDYLGNGFRIIDYKSSSKNITKGNIQKGLELQLISYSILYALSHHQAAFAALYFNTAPQILTKQQYSFSKTRGFFEEGKWTQEKRWKGALYDKEAKEYLPTDSYCSSSYFELNQLKNTLDDIYRDIYRQLKAGNIDLIFSKEEEKEDYYAFPEIYLEPYGRRVKEHHYIIQKEEENDGRE